MRLIPVGLFLVTLVCSLQASSGFAQEDIFPYLTNGQVFISENFRGHKVRDNQSLNVTDYYFIQTNFINDDQETKSFSQVYFVAMVLDQDGIGHYVDLNTYGEKVWSGNESSLFSIPWFLPQLPGEYTIKTFLISGLDTPQVLTRVATLNVTVNEKIDKLGEGESNSRILVQSINITDNSVHVIETFCVGSSYHDEVEAILHVGERVSIAAVDVYFLGIEGSKAIFRLEANASWESDVCLI
ncbi:MAG: hypothetical protein ACREBU_20990 [Nitrososphaera sp.]